MLVKPRTPTSIPASRIDGISYGYTAIGCVANTWRYPLGSPSLRFTQSNDLIRALDQQFGDLTIPEKDDWEAWGEYEFMRALCQLFWNVRKDRTPDEFAKACFVNCNVWRENLAQPFSVSVPVNDLVRTVDNFFVYSTNPLTVQFDHYGAVPSFPLYLSLWADVRSNPPAADVPPQSLKWFANIPFTFGTPYDIQSVFENAVGHWPGCYVQLGAAPGAVGSCPFVGLQAGTYL